MTLLQAATEFLLMMVGLLVALTVIAFHKAEWSVTKFKENWVKAEGSEKPIWKGMLKILAAPLLIGILLYAVNVEATENVHPSGITWNNEVYANEWRYFDGATVFVGLDYTQGTSPFCKEEGGTNNINSNMGFTQNIARRNQVSVGMKYTHHSCAISVDSRTGYDAIGIYVEWEIGRKY